MRKNEEIKIENVERICNLFSLSFFLGYFSAHFFVFLFFFLLFVVLPSDLIILKFLLTFFFFFYFSHLFSSFYCDVIIRFFLFSVFFFIFFFFIFRSALLTIRSFFLLLLFGTFSVWFDETTQDKLCYNNIWLFSFGLKFFFSPPVPFISFTFSYSNTIFLCCRRGEKKLFALYRI